MGICQYLGCTRNAEGKSDFDLSVLGLTSLSDSFLCSEHLRIISVRIQKLNKKELNRPEVRNSAILHRAQHRASLKAKQERTWRESMGWLVGKSWATENGNGKIVKTGSSLLSAIQRKLRDFGDPKDREVLLSAFAECQKAFGPLVPENQIAETWIGLQRALDESRRRRWNARRSAEWIEVVLFYAGLCAYCEDKQWAHVDHVIPRSKGGSDTIRNVVPACQSCNLAKGARLDWIPRKQHRFLKITKLTVQELKILSTLNQSI